MGRLYGLSRAESRSRADELLKLFELFELEDAADRLVRMYSGGMRRRIDLACGLVHRPKLLFLDEPNDRRRPRVAGGALVGARPVARVRRL